MRAFVFSVFTVLTLFVTQWTCLSTWALASSPASLQRLWNCASAGFAVVLWAKALARYLNGRTQLVLSNLVLAGPVLLVLSFVGTYLDAVDYHAFYSEVSAI